MANTPKVINIVLHGITLFSPEVNMSFSPRHLMLIVRSDPVPATLADNNMGTRISNELSDSYELLVYAEGPKTAASLANGNRRVQSDGKVDKFPSPGFRERDERHNT